MPKVSVYLPDDLYSAARERKLHISALAQEAIEDALRRGSTADWLARVRARPALTTAEISTEAVMEQVKDEWGT